MAAIPQTAIPAGPDTIDLGVTPQQISKVDVLIDRRVAPAPANPTGINGLTTADTVTLEVWCQISGNWDNLGGINARGGIWITKGVTLATEEWSPSFPRPIPAGSPVQLRTNSTAPVVIGGGISTVTFS